LTHDLAEMLLKPGVIRRSISFPFAREFERVPMQGPEPDRMRTIAKGKGAKKTKRQGHPRAAAPLLLPRAAANRRVHLDHGGHYRDYYPVWSSYRLYSSPWLRSTESHLLRRFGCSENRGLLFVRSVFIGTGPTHMPENRQKRSERFRLSHFHCHGDDPLMTDRRPVAHFTPLLDGLIPISHARRVPGPKRITGLLFDQPSTPCSCAFHVNPAHTRRILSL
jgi:hypothetical protein